MTERMTEELRHLEERGYLVRMRQQDNQYQVRVEVPQLPGVVVLMIAGENYPAVPPALIVKQHGQEVDVRDGGVIRKWTLTPGRATLVDVVDGVVNNLAPDPSASYVSPPPSPLDQPEAIDPAGYHAAPTARVDSFEMPAPSAADSRDVFQPREERLPPEGVASEQPGASVSLSEDINMRRTVPPGPTTSTPTWIWIAGGIGAMVLVFGLLWIISTFLFPGNPSYEAAWQQIDAARADGSIQGLESAAEQLDQIRLEDPAGQLFQRNTEATSTLVAVYTQLGNLYLQQEPPDTSNANLNFTRALALEPGNIEAQAGLQRTEELVATQARQQSEAERWQSVENSSDNLPQQITLLNAMLVDGIQTDPAGVPTAVRLHQARMASANQLLAQDPPAYTQARIVLQDAVAAAPDEGSLQEAQTALDAVNQAITNQDNRTRVANNWRSYEQARDLEDWASAVLALEDIVRVAGPQPDPNQYPPADYTFPIGNIANILADTRLDYARDLQEQGRLGDALPQYNAIIDPVIGAGVSQATKDLAAAARDRLTRAQQLWDEVINGLNLGETASLEAARSALEQLQTLEGFGASALAPVGSAFTGESVTTLLAEIDRRLTAPTAVPPTIPPLPTEPPPAVVPTEPLPTAPPVELPTRTVTGTGSLVWPAGIVLLGGR